MPQKGSIIKITGIAITVLIVFFIIYWIYTKLRLNHTNCANMNKLYKEFPIIRSINPINEQFSHNLRDYYIKTAFNCCAAGDFKNDFVNVCALKDCIRQGARCLDFQVFSINDTPVVAVSSQKEFTIKESYNSLEFADVIEIITDYAFSGSTCPNKEDPLIIHLRVMSKNKAIYDKMADVLYHYLEHRLLGREHSYENNGKNLGLMPLKDLMGKVILVVDKTNVAQRFGVQFTPTMFMALNDGTGFTKIGEGLTTLPLMQDRILLSARLKNVITDEQYQQTQNVREINVLTDTDGTMLADAELIENDPGYLAEILKAKLADSKPVGAQLFNSLSGE